MSIKQQAQRTPYLARRKRRGHTHEQNDASHMSATVGLEQGRVPEAPALTHPTAVGLRHAAIRGAQFVGGNQRAQQQVASHAPVQRKPQTVEQRRLSKLYWDRRKSDPAWADELHKVVDARFWKDTGYKVGKPLDPQLAEDLPYVETWLQTRDALMAQFNGQPINDALVLLRNSVSLLDRNTAEAVDGGKIKTFYMEDCAEDPKSDELLTTWGFDKSQFVVLVHPDTKEQMVVQRNAVGFRSDSSIFVKRSAGIQTTKATLVHETNHALRPGSIGNASGNSFDRYKDEFQAYWVDPDFSGETDLDKRAQNIRDHILQDYPLLKTTYDGDADFKSKVDAHKRPDANVINSTRWAAVEAALDGPGSDIDKVITAIKAMSAEERAFVRADPNFTDLLKAKLSADELATVKPELDK